MSIPNWMSVNNRLELKQEDKVKASRIEQPKKTDVENKEDKAINSLSSVLDKALGNTSKPKDDKSAFGFDELTLEQANELTNYMSNLKLDEATRGIIKECYCCTVNQAKKALDSTNTFTVKVS